MAYNGWKNYETWNVALWIDNDQGNYNHRQSLAQDAWDDAEAGRYSTREQNAKSALADSLKDWIEEQNPLANEASMFADLMNAALSEVDWYEIAENFLEDVDKEPEESEDEDEDDECMCDPEGETHSEGCERAGDPIAKRS